MEAVTEQMWVIDDGKMVQRQVTYVPGLFKIFDEILVNAADNKQRDSSMDSIKIDIHQYVHYKNSFNESLFNSLMC